MPQAETLRFGMGPSYVDVSDMTTVHDVAAYLLRSHGPMTAYKLQKLLYYSQVWAVVWDGAPLFEDAPEAWLNGPVIPSVFDGHRGQRTVRSYPGDPDVLEDTQRATVDAVLDFYGEYDGEQLSELTHRELPWRAASGRGRNTVITPEEMRDYYGALPELLDCGKHLPQAYRRGVEMLLAMTEDEVTVFYQAEGFEDPPDWLSDL